MKEVVTKVLRGAEVEFGDVAADVMWLRWDGDDANYLLPPDAPVTIDGSVRGRSWCLYWLMLNRSAHVAVDLTIHTDRDGDEVIVAAQMRKLVGPGRG